MDQLQAIKKRFNNIPDGYTISEGVKLIEQMSIDGIALVAEVERLHKLVSEISGDVAELTANVLSKTRTVRRGFECINVALNTGVQ